MGAAEWGIVLNSAGFLAVIAGLVKLEHRLTKLETTQHFMLKERNGADNE